MVFMETCFTPLRLPRITLPHRILRAATYENMADEAGFVGPAHAALYANLARGNVGTIITGFAFVSREGHAMQKFQAGIDADDKIDPWKKVLASAHSANPETKLILQIAHTGRQTISEITGRPVVGAGPVRCTYFLSRVRTLSERQVAAKVREYVDAAVRAEKAGFAGVQVHAAHGYLVHQFLSPHTNRRTDRYGSDPLLFLREIIAGIREKTNLAVFLKLSGADDNRKGLNLSLMKSYVRAIDTFGVDAIEVSYGTMELAFNIIRGGHPLDVVLRHNRLFDRWGSAFKLLFKHFAYPLYKRQFIAYKDLYNLENAVALKNVSTTPILVTGGIRSGNQIAQILDQNRLDGVALCRPFVREPDFIRKLAKDPRYRSTCVSCNLCSVMSDSPLPVQCYLGRLKECLS